MTPFLENVLSLLQQKGVSKNKMLTELKLGKNSFVNWENRGTIPGGDTLHKIAEYFGVSTDYLLGNESNENMSISDNDLKFALFNGTEGVTDEMFNEVKQFAEMVKMRENAKRKETK